MLTEAQIKGKIKKLAKENSLLEIIVDGRYFNDVD